MMLQAIEHRIDQRLLVEQIIPVRQIEIGVSAPATEAIRPEA
jgi:hypothetical protein